MALHGADVTFVDQWREHVEAMRRDGLTLDGVRGRRNLSVRALLPEELREPVELAFIAVKSQHTDAAVEVIRPLLAEDATVVSLQNGFNAERIAAALGRERVIGSVPDYTAALVAPGFLEFTVEGPIYIGELDGAVRERTRAVQRLLGDLTATEVTDNIEGRIWTKQCYMSWIVMTALVDASFNEVMASIRNRMLGVAVVREAIGVADRFDVRLEADAYFEASLLRDRSLEARRAQSQRIQTLMNHFARGADDRLDDPYPYVKKGSGMWWDIVYRRRPSETRWITGAVVERGQALGLPLPLNSALAGMIYDIEQGRRGQSWQNIDELAELARQLGEPLTLDDGAPAEAGA
jgi:2-dehydropantoate 2-reductase